MAQKEEASQAELATAVKWLAVSLVAGGVGFGAWKYAGASQAREEALRKELDSAKANQSPLNSIFSGTQKPNVGAQILGVAGQALQAVGGFEGIVSLLGRK